MGKLTKRTIEALKPKAAGDVFLWDNELKGFGVRMKPSGAASFLIQYRNQHGETRRLALGKIGTLTPDEARTVARRKLATVAEGADPSAERHASRDALTVSDLCEWYLEQARAGRLLGKNGRRIKASTLNMDRSRIEAHVKPLIGKRAVAGLTLDDIEQLQADIAEGRTAKGREGRGGNTTGGAAVAGRTVGMLHAILEQAKRRKNIGVNPADGVRKMVGGRRKRRLSEAELESFGRAMGEAAANGENTTGVAAIRALLLTGFRRMEVMGMRREWLDERERSVHFPDTKSGEQVRPIGRAALKALQSVPTRDGCPYVFPSDLKDSHGHFVGVVKVLERIAGRAGLKDVSPHVLRHTFSSIAGDLGFSKLTIAGLLGHAAKGDTESYVHLDTALLAAAERVSAHIAEALDGQPTNKVVDLHQRAG
jgi:integrase